MKKRINSLLAVLLCLAMIFSTAGAFDSPWDRYQGPIITKEPDPGTVSAPTAEPVDLPTEEPVIEAPAAKSEKTIAEGLHDKTEPKTGTDVVAEPEPAPIVTVGPDDIFSGFSGDTATRNTVTLNSLNIYGSTDQSVTAILDKLQGMRIISLNQKGEYTRSAFSLSLQDRDILSYEFQGGLPYYVKSNFLGNDTYMIFPEDEFAEKLVSSFYDLIERVSDDTSQLPPKEEVIDMIHQLREGVLNPSDMMPQMSFELTQQIDPSALTGVFMDVMMRFTEADPTPNIGYRYTDLDLGSMEYEWPAVEGLPAPEQAESATSGVFYGQDLVNFLDALPQFMADNPELAATVNELVIQAVQRTNPGTEIPEGTDMIGELLTSLKESAQGALDFYLSLKIDNGRYGSPALITAEFGKAEETGNSGIILTIMMVNDYPVSTMEVAADAFQGGMSQPVMRMLTVTENGAANSVTANVMFTAPGSNSGFEMAINSETADPFAAVSEEHTTIRFSADGQHGNLTVDKLPAGGSNSTSLITYEHSAGYQPIFGFTMTSETEEVEALPELTPADAVHVSDMSLSDFEDVASNIFLQLMNLVMMFM